MSMVGQDRGDAVYQAMLANNPRCANMTASELAAMRTTLRSLFTADTTYITGHAQVNPGTLENASNLPVATTGNQFAQSGYVTAQAPIVGLGTVS